MGLNSEEVSTALERLAYSSVVATNELHNGVKYSYDEIKGRINSQAGALIYDESADISELMSLNEEYEEFKELYSTIYGDVQKYVGSYIQSVQLGTKGLGMNLEGNPTDQKVIDSELEEFLKISISDDQIINKMTSLYNDLKKGK